MYVMLFVLYSVVSQCSAPFVVWPYRSCIVTYLFYSNVLYCIVLPNILYCINCILLFCIILCYTVLCCNVLCGLEFRQ